MTKIDLESPVHIDKGNLLFTWAGVVAIALVVSAWVRLEAKTQTQDQRLAAVEQITANVATKSDLQQLQARIDRVLELLADKERGSHR